MTLIKHKWARVTRQHPCPICKKHDWCTMCSKYVCCMRVESPKPSKNGGWLHAIETAAPVQLPPRAHDTRPTINATAIMRDLQAKTDDLDLMKFANRIGVNWQTLRAIGTAWAPRFNAWAFPMKDAYNNTVGIRLRNDVGEKWAVKGSRAGLFYDVPPVGEVWICEGPTDTAAALTLGARAIGRPSCRGSEDEILTLIRQCNRVLIVSDNDGPGWSGAEQLQAKIRALSLIWSPPTKDLRSFLTHGGSMSLLQSLINGLKWKNG